jgi:hypothetical protein
MAASRYLSAMSRKTLPLGRPLLAPWATRRRCSVPPRLNLMSQDPVCAPLWVLLPDGWREIEESSELSCAMCAWWVRGLTKPKQPFRTERACSGR